MPSKVKPSEHQVLINKFALLLLKHFKGAKIKAQDTNIKINLEQLSGQDFEFLYDLNESTGYILGLNAGRSGKGIYLIIGVAQLQEVPDFLMNYKREGK